MGVVKKPQSAYFQFSGERRKKIAEENPGLRVGDIQKLITAQWKELTDEEKQVRWRATRCLLHPYPTHWLRCNVP
jgi:hypothetical protein